MVFSTPPTGCRTGAVQLGCVHSPTSHGRLGHVRDGERDGVPDSARVAASLRAVLAAVDSGELAADDAQRAYLAGAAEALEALATPPAPDRPSTGLR
jgi:hypothetical protein